MNNLDIHLLAQAIRLAEKGKYSTHPNPRVGCIIARHDQVVGEGYHLLAGRDHAEAIALEAAGDLAKGATAYISLEPCSFEGRTPSCAKSVVSAGIERAVVAMLDPDARNAGAGIQILRDAGIEVVSPLLESSARALNPGHVKRHEYGMPFVRLKLAMTLDGKTALDSGESNWITSKESRADVQKIRAMSSAIVTGVQTVIDDDPRLNVREEELDTPHLKEALQVVRPVFILDSNLRVPGECQLLQRQETVVVTAAEAESIHGVEVLTLPRKGSRVDLRALLSELASRDHSEVLIECGRTLAGAFVTEDLVDELILYIAPRLMGDGRSLLKLPEIDRMSDLWKLNIDDIQRIGGDIKITATFNN